MKLPAYVLAEALSSLAEWRVITDDPERAYGFPRQFDGSESVNGHVQILAPGNGAVSSGQGTLSVYTAPGADLPAGSEALIPDRPVPSTDAERMLIALYDRMDRWDDALCGCSPDIGGVRRMLSESVSVMGGSFVLIDESYNTPAVAGLQAEGYHISAEGTMRPADESIAQLADDPQITAVRSLRGVHVYESPAEDQVFGRVLFRNFFRPGEDHYFNRLLFARPSGEYSRTDSFMLEHLSRRMEPVTRNLSTFSMPVSRYAALQRLLLSAAGSDFRPDQISAALSPLGWKRADRCRVLVLRSVYERRDPGISDYILRMLEQRIPDSLGAVSGERILLAVNIGRCSLTVRDLRALLAEFLRENMYKAGISEEASSFELLRGAYLQASAALELGSGRDPTFWYYLFEDYLGDYLLRKAAEDIPPEMLILPAVETLRRHDALRGTHFAETLRVFAGENFNATHAARKLFIHRTSFQDRMDRICALTGLDPDDEETRFLLQFSFRLLRDHP